MNDYPRGSQWRKWDLHVHAPGTRLSDQYALKDGLPDVGQFCQILHESDVAAVAITDYFCLDTYFAVKAKFVDLYPDSRLLLLPNLELRLPVAVNQEEQSVNLHLIFNPSLTEAQAQKFLGSLKTAATSGTSRLQQTCADLSTKQDFESATVSLTAVDEAIKATFGDHAVVPSHREKHLLIVASGKGDGIRPGGNGIQRKKLLTDEIDKFVDAIFANPRSRDYYLDPDRLETDERVASRPVFDGCDAHSFDDLRATLGKQVTTEGRQRNVTWIKADPTYAGLLQTLIEPAERVAMQAAEPDQKEPYKVISRVAFSGTTEFPSEVLFNRNLNAIIGSRSSGKSALMAYIAHAVDPEETLRVQSEATGRDAREVGPAAGLTWSDVSAIDCKVEWESGEGTSGKIIYIPQNSLYTISEQPDEITKKITPALFRTYPALKTANDGAMSKASSGNTDIRNAVEEWFRLADRIEERTHEIRDLGDKTAIIAERDRLQAEVDRIKAAAKLTDSDVATYQDLAAQLDSREGRLKEIATELDQLSSYVSLPEGTAVATIRPEAVQATVTVRPSSSELPDVIAASIDRFRAEAGDALVQKVEKSLVDAVTALDTERASLRTEIVAIKDQNGELIARHEANEELAAVVADHKNRVAALDEIAKREKSRDRLVEDQGAAARRIEVGIADRDQALDALKDAFESDDRVLTDLRFGIEAAVPDGVVEHASVGFSQRSTNEYIKSKGDPIAYALAQADPVKFLQALRDRKITLNKGYASAVVAAEVLTVTKEVRFSAELDSDRIGGFSRSSMTPGKQALFALTLILNESQEPWPLLVDQPEDDLDSRSIYDTIVPYLLKRKKERQIIMVSHNANLVIGADSEQVVVANRHGDDRKNKAGRTFDYLTGSLEHSQPLNDSSPTTLGRFGIREHACEILDGGEEAFQKRREKYKI